jgi:hypothetical protein
MLPPLNLRSPYTVTDKELENTNMENTETKIYNETPVEMIFNHQVYLKLARAFKADTESVMAPLRKPDNSMAYEDDDKSECLADSLKTRCPLSRLPSDPVHIAHVDSEVERLTHDR